MSTYTDPGGTVHEVPYAAGQELEWFAAAYEAAWYGEPRPRVHADGHDISAEGYAAGSARRAALRAERPANVPRWEQ